MFALAASAAAQAAAVRPGPPVKRNSGGNKDRKKARQVQQTQPSKKPTEKRKSAIKKTVNVPTPVPETVNVPTPVPATRGIRSILKKEDDTVATAASSFSFRTDNCVTFSSLNIALHVIQLGDCPYCEGPPLAISNEILDRLVLDLDEFEEERGTRRGRRELVLSPNKRSSLLLSMGYSIETLVGVSIATQRARMERAVSLENKRWDTFNAVGERFNRTLKKILLGKNGRAANMQTTFAPASA